MGMRDEIQSELAQAFDAEDELFDAVTEFTCERKILVSNHPINGPIYNTVSYHGRGVFGSYNQYEVVTLGVLATDKKVLVLQNEITEFPKLDDVFVTTDGEFRVMNISADPVGASWTLQVRAV